MHIAMLVFISGPEDPLFEKFAVRFLEITIDYNNFSTLELDNTIPVPKTTQDALKTLEFLRRHLLADDFPRNDNREIAELAIKILNGQVRFATNVMIQFSFLQCT